MKIKCKYVAKIIIDCDFDTSIPGLVSPDELKEQWTDLNKIIKEVLVDELGLEKYGKIKVIEIENEIK